MWTASHGIRMEIGMTHGTKIIRDGEAKTGVKDGTTRLQIAAKAITYVRSKNAREIQENSSASTAKDEPVSYTRLY